MVFAMGSSCFLHSPFPTSYPLSSSSSSQSVFLYSSQRNANGERKGRALMACMRHEDPNDGVFCKRRAILFVGISNLPILKLRAKAVESLAPEDSDISTQEQKQNAEQSLQGHASSNPFLSFLNGLGILSSGLLGALYALAQKEKTATKATIESMKKKLQEKEAALVLLQRKSEAELLNEKEERNKQLKKANEERQSFVNQLKSANGTITDLGKELQKERRFIEELKVQIHNLTTNIAKAGEDKKELEEKLKEKLDSVEVLQERISLLRLEIKDKEDNLCDLSSTLASKESEFKKLSSIYEQTQGEVVGLKSEIKGLKDELMKIEKELELKNSAVVDLNAQVRSLLVERNESNRKLDALKKKYSDLKLSSEKKADSDAKLLEEREIKLQQLKKQLELALAEVSKTQVLVADLTEERDDLRRVLDVELKNVKNLEKELEITQGTLEKSKKDASVLATQLQQSRNLCSELEAEVSQVRDRLQKELVGVYKQVDSAAHDLKEEKKIVASLNKELKALETQISKDKEGRKSLETDLEEATKSLDEMNRNALIFSRELELANSRISTLEDEKDVLYNSLAEQKHVSQEARENMEDAHNLVMRLGKEKETLEKRSKKLEEELASAKGEILRMRSRINSSKAPVNDQPQQTGETEGNAAVPVKKTRRKKVVSKQDKS